MNQAKELFLAQEYSKALPLYLQLTKTEGTAKDKSICALNAGLCLMKLNQNEQALEFIELSIKLNPTYTKAHYRKAQVLGLLKRYGEAIEIVQILSSKEPSREIEELKNQIIEAFCNPNEILQELSDASTEKDVIKVFNNLYSKTDYLKIDISETGFFFKLFQIADPKLEHHRLKYINFILSTKYQELLKLPHWLQELLVNNYQYYRDLKTAKPHETQQFYMQLLARCSLNQSLIALILENEHYFFDKHLAHTARLFINNKSTPCQPEELEKIANYIKREVELNSEQFSMLIEIIADSLKPQLRFFGFLKRDNYRQQDLILLIAMAQVGQLGEIMKLYDVVACLLRTIRTKQKKTKTIDLCNQLLMVSYLNSEFQTKLNKDSMAIIEDLMEYLKEYRKSKDFGKNVKYLCLLFQLQSQGKYLQLYEYVYLSDAQQLLKHLQEDIEIDEALVLMQFVSTFDDVKKLIVDDKKLLQEFSQHVLQGSQKSSFDGIRYFFRFMGFLNILVQLCSDHSQILKEKSKEAYSLDDESYEMARQIQEKYNKDPSHQYLTYNMEFIQKHNVLRFVLVDLKIVQHLSKFVHDYENVFDDGAIKAIVTLLSRLVHDEQLQNYLLDKKCLRLASQAVVKYDQTEAVSYLSKVMRFANPQLFEFSEAQMLTDALLKCAQLAKHELETFYSLLGVVQLTSLGEFVCKRMISRNDTLILQNYLLEQNRYIVHCSLQILNNLALMEEFQQQLQDRKFETLIKIIVALARQNFEELESSDKQVTDFSHPAQSLATILSLICLIGQNELIQQKLKLELSDVILSQHVHKHILKINPANKQKIDFLVEMFSKK